MNRKEAHKIWKELLISTLIPVIIIGGIFACYIFPGSPVNLYRKIEGTNLHSKQCDLPLFYRISKNFSKKKIKVIKNGFNYWNNIAKKHGKIKKIFYYGGLTEDPTNYLKLGSMPGIVNVIPKEISKGSLKGLTFARDSSSGCIYAADILLIVQSREDKGEYQSKYEEIPEEMLSATIRHEIGHVLGFNHSDTPWHLMYYDTNPIFPTVELSKWEIEAFKVYY